MNATYLFIKHISPTPLSRELTHWTSPTNSGKDSHAATDSPSVFFCGTPTERHFTATHPFIPAWCPNTHHLYPPITHVPLSRHPLPSAVIGSTDAGSMLRTSVAGQIFVCRSRFCAARLRTTSIVVFLNFIYKFFVLSTYFIELTLTHVNNYDTNIKGENWRRTKMLLIRNIFRLIFTRILFYWDKC